MPEKCPIDTDRACFRREMCQQDRQFDIMVRCIKRIMFREFRKESMQRSYILANAKVIFRLLAEVTVLSITSRRANITATQYHCESNITVEDNLTAKAIFRKGNKLLDIAGFFGYTRFAS